MSSSFTANAIKASFTLSHSQCSRNAETQVKTVGIICSNQGKLHSRHSWIFGNFFLRNEGENWEDFHTQYTNYCYCNTNNVLLNI